MLRSLRIRNLAVIEELHVEFGPGLNVFTGETGAGKSILLDALGLAGGERADSGAVRAGAARATVEAVFESGADGAAAAALDDLGIDVEDGILIVRRDVRAEGAGRAFVNDSPCTIGALRASAGALIDLLGQNRHQGLRSREAQRDLLDAFGGHAGEVAAVRAAHGAVREARGRLDALVGRRRSRDDRAETLERRVSEIDEVGPRPGERDGLERERRMVVHAERIRRALESATARLTDDDGAAAAGIAAAERELKSLADVDPSFGERAERLRAARVEVEDVADSLRGTAEDDAHAPDRADRIESRLAALERLFLRYGETEEEILAVRETAAAELATLDDLEGEIERAGEGLAEAERSYDAAAAALTGRREQAARRLRPAVERALRDLAMGKARFRVELTPASDGDGDPARAPTGAHGREQVEFLLAANPGEPPRPLRQVASGGELSRMLLALHGALGGGAEILVFDEVDAGVGGSTADAVGRRLARLARDRQVLCVTHLPQVAAYADRHYIVSKRVEGGRTRTEVRAVEDRARVDELARMLGGRGVTAASRRNAEELIAAAREARTGAGRTA